MRVLVVGSGGREHCLAWKLSQSPSVSSVFCAPGNAGTAAIGSNLPVSADDFDGLGRICREKSIDLVVVGPEAPLVAGLADHLSGLGVAVFGPSSRGAMIEGSKSWAKEIMHKANVPTASSVTFTDRQEALRYVEGVELPVVIKADGLAAGKGVIIAGTLDEARKAIDDIMERRAFGDAGERLLVEEFLTGPEVSVLAISDGETVLPLLPACDYKRAFDDDQGPNTGGMGAYCPTRLLSAHDLSMIQKTILEPVVRAMRAEGIRYVGVLYAGLMVTPKGIRVLEFNCRFGDPETQVVLPLMSSDLAGLAMAAVDGRLHESHVEWEKACCCGVVVAAGGYPGTYAKGALIGGLADIPSGCQVFHAGTSLDSSGRAVSSGGRVLNIVALGETMSEARTNVYKCVSGVGFEGSRYRSDIALRESI